MDNSHRPFREQNLLTKIAIVVFSLIVLLFAVGVAVVVLGLLLNLITFVWG